MRLLSRVVIFIFLFLLYDVEIESVASENKENGEVNLYFDRRPPLHYFENESKLTGEFIETLRCVERYATFKLNLHETSWKRALAAGKDQSIDGFFSASRNAERDQYAVFSGPVIHQYWSWYYLDDAAMNHETNNPVPEATVTSWLGSNTFRWLEKNGYNVVTPPPLPDQLLTFLLSGRADVVFAGDSMFDYYLSNRGEHSTVIKKKKIYEPLGIYFTKKFILKNSAIASEFDFLIRKCRCKSIQKISFDK